MPPSSSQATGELACSHCGKKKHTKEQCFVLIGFPDWRKDPTKRPVGRKRGRAEAAMGNQEATNTTVDEASLVGSAAMAQARFGGGMGRTLFPIPFHTNYFQVLTALDGENDDGKNGQPREGRERMRRNPNEKGRKRQSTPKSQKGRGPRDSPNQGEGCCWAFSAAAATEGINQLTTGNLVSLSGQELVDCDTSEDQGCNGGLMDDAFEFIISNKGLTTESNYPYKGVYGTCDSNKESSDAAKITWYEDVPANSESAVLKAVVNQPVSIAIDASGSDFQFYSSGVFTGECGTERDHGVTAVGYGAASDGTKYWLVKNSWGTSWGENGYTRMQRDIGAAEGLCGIAMEASYPTACNC